MPGITRFFFVLCLMLALQGCSKEEDLPKTNIQQFALAQQGAMDIEDTVFLARWPDSTDLLQVTPVPANATVMVSLNNGSWKPLPAGGLPLDATHNHISLFATRDGWHGSSTKTIIRQFNSQAVVREFAPFPNPARQQISLHLNNKLRGWLQFRLLNLQGQLLQVVSTFKRSDALSQTFLLETLEPGPYVLYMQIGDQQHQARLVKQ